MHICSTKKDNVSHNARKIYYIISINQERKIKARINKYIEGRAKFHLAGKRQGKACAKKMHNNIYMHKTIITGDIKGNKGKGGIMAWQGNRHIEEGDGGESHVYRHKAQRKKAYTGRQGKAECIRHAEELRRHEMQGHRHVDSPPPSSSELDGTETSFLSL